jgi:predicted outer membrane protein
MEVEVSMRKWKVAVAVAGLLVSSMAAMASAQTAHRGYQNQYEEGQFEQQGYNQVYNQGQANQYQRSGPASGQRYTSRRVGGPMQAHNFTDEQLASWLLVDNRGEIQLARLAQERASSDEVKDFAKKVIDEHAQLVEQLQQFAGQGRGTRQGGEYQATAQRNRSSQATNMRNEQYGQPNAAGRGNQQPGGLNLVRLKQQLGQQCVASAEHELEQKEGEEFDKCFIGMQIAKHMEMVDTLKVFSRYASQELDQLIEQAEQTTEDHLQHAKHLIKQLEKGDDSSTSSRSSSLTTRSRDESSSDRSSRNRES